ncbi:MAG: DUF2804 domain-containing protein [Deltaproteobacteria bacterium]|nr:DUF2804 domain-containing protein [Deltaproteobacteria bacterium]
MEERRLINEDGRPNFGIFSKPLNRINIEDLRPYGGREFSFFGKGVFKTFKIKRWQYIGLTSPDIVFGSAIVSAGYIGNIFFYLYNRKSKEISEVNMIRPFAAGISFEGSADEGKISFENGSIALKYEISPVHINPSLRYRNIMTADVRFIRIPEPLSVVVRESLDGFNYTNKEAGLEAEGELSANGTKYVISKHNSFGVMDYTIGQLSRETFWNWASGGGILENGKRFGFNLSAGVNETGVTENVFWVENRLHKIETVRFTYSDLNIMNEWKIASNDNKLNLVFMPEGLRKADINAVLIKSKFFQPFGKFNGFIKTEKEKIALSEVYGFAEEHFAKW